MKNTNKNQSDNIETLGQDDAGLSPVVWSSLLCGITIAFLIFMLFT